MAVVRGVLVAQEACLKQVVLEVGEMDQEAFVTCEMVGAVASSREDQCQVVAYEVGSEAEAVAGVGVAESVPLVVDASTVEVQSPGEVVAVGVKMLHYLAVWAQSVVVQVVVAAVAEVPLYLNTNNSTFSLNKNKSA